MITRRDLLWTGGLLAVGALGGCLEAVRSPGAGDPDDGSNGGTPGGVGGVGIALGAVDDPSPLPVRPAVEITRDTATESHPSQRRVTVANDGKESIRVGEGREIVFVYVSDTGGLPDAGERVVWGFSLTLE